MAQCPQGHVSEAADYCDTCGVPMDAPAAPSTSDAAPPAASGAGAGGGAAGSGHACPNCQAENLPEALFCEACGYDFTTGTLPRTQSANPFDLETPTNDAAAPTATPFTFVVEQWIDPDWYELQDSPDQLPSAGLPEIVPLRKESLLIGRPSDSRNIAPDIDCDPDSGVSRRHAQLTTDGSRWWVEDLDSSNGTFVADAAAALPEDPISVGQKTEVRVGERIYLGGWTRLVIRRATEDEQQNL
ncbi:MAG: FHA domain-containing protein [Propionibacteriaceae bacterium]